MALVPGEACAAAGSARATRNAAVNMAAVADTSNLRRSLVLFICILPVFVICNRCGFDRCAIVVFHLVAKQRTATAFRLVEIKCVEGYGKLRRERLNELPFGRNLVC